MWDKKAAAGYFGFAQKNKKKKKQIPSFIAQAMASRARCGPSKCQRQW